MKRIVSLIMAVALLFSCLALFSSCANYNDEEKISVYYVGNLYDFDPAMNFTNDEAMEVFNLLYDPLFTLNADGSVSGALVSKWKYDVSTRVLTLTLRDTCWNDGTAVLAEDVVYAWKRILACDFESAAAPLLYDIENAYECKFAYVPEGEDQSITTDDIGVSVDIRDTKTLYVTLREGADINGFLKNLTQIAVTALDEDTVNTNQRDYWAKRSATLKTSGPFCIRDINYNMGYFKLGRNNYYRLVADTDVETVDLTKYVLPELLSTTWVTATKSFQAGKANLAKAQTSYYNELMENFLDGLETAYADTVFYMGEMTLDQRAELKDSANLKIADSLSTYTYVFNLNNPASPLVQNAKVRVAISNLISRAAICEKIVFGKAATGFISNGVQTNDGKAYRSVAEALLSEEATAVAAAKTAIGNAALALKGAEIEYPEKSGKPLLTLVCRDNEEEKAIAETVKSALSTVVTLEIVYVSYNYISDTIATDEGTDPAETTMVFDALTTAYTRAADGGLYYYAYNDSSRTNPIQYDMIAIDYQMLSIDPFTVLAGFSSNYNGNGIDTSLRTEETASGVREYFAYENRTSTCGWQNDAYDAKIAAAYNETDAASRMALLMEAEEILLSEMPVIPLVFNQNYAVINPMMEGVVLTPYYGYFNMTRAYVKDYDKLTERED